MESRVSGVPAAHELLEAVSGTGGQTTSQSDPGPILHGEMLYLVALPYSHDSAPTSEPLRLVTWGGRGPGYLPPGSSYTSPGKARIIHRGGYHQTISSASFESWRQ